jgi:hypothetical protein
MIDIDGIRIIRKGNIDNTSLRFACKTCGCIWDADCRWYKSNLIQGSGGTMEHYMDCPMCRVRCFTYTKD